MNLSLLFKIQGVVLIVNGLGSFLGSIWIALGTGWEATADLITFGQFTGVVFCYCYYLTFFVDFHLPF